VGQDLLCATSIYQLLQEVKSLSYNKERHKTYIKIDYSWPFRRFMVNNGGSERSTYPNVLHLQEIDSLYFDRTMEKMYFLY